MTVQVTEVDIGFVKPKDGVIAFASVVLDDQPYLSASRSIPNLSVPATA
jgi:hypothetical protein